MMKKKCPKCGKYMMNVADDGQVAMWECCGDGCDTSADGDFMGDCIHIQLQGNVRQG